MKVHAFKLEPEGSAPDIEATIKKIENTTLTDRWKTVNTKALRAEDVSKIKGINGRQIWLMDFVLQRQAGPGKVDISNPITGFKFKGTESFGEETAALYEPESNYLLVQYNHYGLRHSAIGQYVSLFTNNNGYYYLAIKMTEDAEEKLARKTLFRKFTIKVDMSKIGYLQRQTGLSLTSALNELNSDIGGNTALLVVSLGHEGPGATLDGANIKKYIRRLLPFIDDSEKPPVKGLQLEAKDDFDTAPEILNFLGQRLAFEQKIKVGPDLRYSREDRYNVLMEALSAWQELLTQ